MTPIKIATGTKINKLVAKCFSHSTPNGRYWTFVCDCGKTTNKRLADVANGKITSCGCTRIELLKRRSTKHGLAAGGRNATYKSWSSMIQRCTNKNNPMYSYYGGRGISVCEKWLTFSGFFEDMGEKPGKDFSIERTNVNLGYCKENAIWIHKSQQSGNRRNVMRVSMGGKLMCIKQWAHELGVPYWKLRKRIYDNKEDPESIIRSFLDG